MKLRNKLYAIMLIVSIVPLLFCALVMIYQNGKNVEQVIKKNVLGVSQSQIDNIENFSEQIKQDLEILSQYEFLQQEVLVSLNRIEPTGPEARSHIEELLVQQRRYQPYIQSMAVVDKNLRVVAVSEANYIAGGSSGLGEIEDEFLTGEFCIGNIYTRKINNRMTRAVLAYQGVYYEEELIGYIVQEILADYYSKYHQGNIFWENGTMQILDGNDEIVTVGGYGEGQYDFIDVQDLHDRRVERKQKSEGYEYSGSMDYEISGVKYVTCYSKLQYTDWIIRVTVNVDNYQEFDISYIAIFITVILMGTLILTVLHYYITVKITLPMERIRTVLMKVQETEDYSIRLEPDSDDEVGEMQHEINHLLQCVMESQMEDKEEQKSLERKAEKDPMTGVMNKKAIAARVQQLAEEIEPREGKIAVGFVDIDDFRDFNTNYGHAEGDHVIKYVANTLRETIPGSVGRNGGDEFVFCMETDGREFVAQTMELLIRKLQKGVINGVTGENMPIPCSRYCN